MRKPELRALLLVMATACGDSNAPATADASIDVVSPDGPPVIPCSQTTTAMVEANGKTYGFAALGNVDAGGEPNCSGPPEAILIMFGREPIDAQTIFFTDRVSFSLPLPVATGSRTITVNSEEAAPVTATVDVTSVTVDGGGPGLMQVTGTLSGAVTGDFTASHCTQLDVMCI